MPRAVLDAAMGSESQTEGRRVTPMPKPDAFPPLPPPYPSRATLAYLLDCSESTVDEMVKRGVIPPPMKLSAGCVRWCWADVETALQARKGGPAEVSDPYSRGVKNATQTSQGRGDAT
jgi:predicted DNA-binding transcriptional regulator AlpA